jgi:DNA-directed RNA polymerase specialized sigma24 family protein
LPPIGPLAGPHPLSRHIGAIDAPVTLADGAGGFDQRPLDVVALDDALATLATFDERKSRVVELRFFGGLTVEETAQALEVSADTVMRDWKLAKAWLLRELIPGTRVPER